MNNAQLQPVPPEHEWMDAQQIMQMLNIGIHTLKNWRRAGKISYSKLGGKLYYNAIEIKQTLVQNMQCKK